MHPPFQIIYNFFFLTTNQYSISIILFNCQPNLFNVQAYMPWAMRVYGLKIIRRCLQSKNTFFFAGKKKWKCIIHLKKKKKTVGKLNVGVVNEHANGFLQSTENFMRIQVYINLPKMYKVRLMGMRKLN